MNRVVGTYVMHGVAYEIHGEFEMYPELNEAGVRVNRGYDFYDIYTYGHTLKCLTCLNEGQPFKTIPTEDVVRKFLGLNDEPEEQIFIEYGEESEEEDDE